MTTLDNKGNTKLVLEDNKIVAIYENRKLYLTSYKIKLGGDYYFTHKQTNSTHHFQDPWLASLQPAPVCQLPFTRWGGRAVTAGRWELGKVLF